MERDRAGSSVAGSIAANDPRRRMRFALESSKRDVKAIGTESVAAHEQFPGPGRCREGSGARKCGYAGRRSAGCVPAEEGLSRVEAIVITAKCAQGHSQTLGVGPGMDLVWARHLAGLMDGTSDFYVHSPRGDDSSLIGRCGICGSQIDCKVEQG